MNVRYPKSKQVSRGQENRAPERGFSLIEMMISVLIITLLMGAVFQFMAYNQKRYRGDQLLAERNSGARGALELLTIEIQQAGDNPVFSPNKTLAAAITSTSLTGGIINVPVSDVTNLHYGNMVEIGPSTTDPHREAVTIKGDATHAINSTATPNTFPAIITLTHSSGQPVIGKSVPFATGVLYAAGGVTSTITPAYVNTVQFYGDIVGDGTLSYAEYTLVDTGTTSDLPCQTTASATPTANCHLYQMNRFITQILNPNIPASKAVSGSAASPLADNILGYPDAAGAVRNPDYTAIFTLNYETFGSTTYGLTTFVRSVDVSLTLETVNKDPEVNEYRTIRMRSHVVPTNINDAWNIVLLGGMLLLPATPKDPSNDTLPLP